MVAVQWGDVPTGVGGVGTILAIAFAALTWNSNQTKARDERRQAQAGNFDAWLSRINLDIQKVETYDQESPVGYQFLIQASNASSQSVRGVDVGIHIPKDSPPVLVGLGVIPPDVNGQPTAKTVFLPLSSDFDKSLKEEHLLGMAAVDVSFTDARGNRWHRATDGELRFLYNLADRAKQQS